MSDEQSGPESLDLTCHVCTSLLPLLRKVNLDIAAVEERQSQVQNEEGLRYDVDKVFDSLYTSISQRESELLQLIDEKCGSADPDEELTSLLEHLQNVHSYCQKTLIYTTKPELLHLTGMIQSRAEELLTYEPTEDRDPAQGIVIKEEGLEDLLSQIEEFGKVFNVADVDTAVKAKSFPTEQTGLDEDILTRIMSLSSKPEAEKDQEDDEDTPLLPQDESAPKKLTLAAMLAGQGDSPTPGNSRDSPDWETNNQASNSVSTDERDTNGSGRFDGGSTNIDAIVPQVASQQKSMRPDGNINDTHNVDRPCTDATGLHGNTDQGASASPDETSMRSDDNRDASYDNETYYGKHEGQKADSGYQSQEKPYSAQPDIMKQGSDQGHPKSEGGTDEDKSGVVSLSAMFSGDTPSGMSPLAMFINKKYDEEANEPATYESMKFTLEQERDSQQDGVFTIFPKMGVVEHTIKCAYMEFDKATVYESNTVTPEGKLVNEPPFLPHPNTSWRFNNYKGALSTRPLDNTGMSYLEFWTDIEIKQAHGGRSLIFEAAVADRNAIDLHHKAEDQDNAWGLSLSNCPTHNGLCRRTWAAGKALEHFPNTLPNEAKARAQLRFGFLFCKKKSKLVIIDCREEKVLLVAENIRLPRPLWPVFGVYNTELSHVETSLVSSTDLHLEKSLAWLIYQNI